MKNNTVSRPPLAPAPRSRPFVWSALLALAAVVGSMLPLQAQTTVLPALVSYQGRVSTAAGLVGAGTPVNRTVTFRIWGSSTGTLAADLLYSETQTVTISDGEFSVLIGQGTAVAGETDKGKPTRTIDSSTVFGGATRYLGVTVDDGTAAADPEISPRQQLVSTAYAFRAKYAESVGTAGLSTLSTTDTGNVGIGNPTPAARLTVTAAGTGTGTPQFIITGADTNERLRFGVDDTGNGTGYVQSFKEAVGNQPRLLNPGGGFVGINKTTAPTVALDVTGAITASGIVTGSSFSTAGTITGGSFTTPGAITMTGPAQFANLTTPGTVSAGQLSTSGRAMANCIEFWTAAAAANGLVLAGAPGVFVSSSSAVANDIVLQSAQKLHFVSGASGSAATMTVSGGAVGIGNSTGLLSPTPGTKANLEVYGGGIPTIPAGYNYKSGGQTTFPGASNFKIGIYSLYEMWTSASFIVSSDARTKTIAGVSDGVSDLRTLMKVEVTDYRYKDTVKKGAESQKKVIAQQVKKVFPQATSMHTDVVPDVYQTATIRDGWVTLATDLRKGERVKLLTDDKDGIYEVLEVGAGQFRTDFKPKDGEIFVYGREVKDFLTVDYDAIAMLNVSATQQVKRDQDAAVKTLTAENAELRAQVAAQRRQLGEFASRAQAQETRLAAIERLVRSGGAATPRAASVKSGEVEE